MIYLKKLWPLAVLLLSLAALSGSAFAKNSPIYPQFQSNGGTAYAAGTKDGGGGGADIERNALSPSNTKDAKVVIPSKERVSSSYVTSYGWFEPFRYSTILLSFYITLNDLDFHPSKAGKTTHPW